MLVISLFVLILFYKSKAVMDIINQIIETINDIIKHD